MRRWVGVLLGAVLAIATVCCAAQAANGPFGFYVGAGLGIGTPENLSVDPFGQYVHRNELGWDAVVGLRPIPWLGGELQYLDFGHTRLGPLPPFGTPFGQPTSPYASEGHTYAAGAFAVGYLPMSFVPPYFELFGKLGVVRLWYPLAYYSVLPAGIANASQSQTDLAYGGGLQLHLGAFAVRAEYEMIDATFGNPSLFTVGVIWAP